LSSVPVAPSGECSRG